MPHFASVLLVIKFDDSLDAHLVLLTGVGGLSNSKIRDLDG